PEGPPAGVFDFFGDTEAAAPPAPPPVPKTSAMPARKRTDAPVPVTPIVEAEAADAEAHSPDHLEPEPAKPAEPAKAPAQPRPTAILAEVSGTPAELLPGDSVRLLEGKTTLRLYRAWLLAVTKYAGGVGRTNYLRLQRLDGATLEQRAEPGPGRREAHA